MKFSLYTSRLNYFDTFICFIMLFLHAFMGEIHADGWKAGVASVIITPKESMWMAGYGSREKPSEGKIHDLFVKALALEDAEGNNSVIVTADIVSVTVYFSNRIAEKINEKFGLPREAILFNTSHTHCGPENRIPIPFYIPEDWENEIVGYTNWLETRYVRVIGEALADLAPADISFASAQPVPFAVSRRYPTPDGIVYRSGPSAYYTGGPRDDTVPVLTVFRPDSTVKAILFGYACHPITLNVYQYCGDYPGFAQRYIENAFPGSTALFVQGCAGQLVPNARYQVEYAQGHGKALADAVINAVEGQQHKMKGTLACAYKEIPLEFEPLPDRAALEANLTSKNLNERRRAEFFLDKMNNNEPIENIRHWPFQAIRFGDNLLLIGLSGEPVVEYAITFKSEFLTYDFVWVAGYSNHGCGYLPTWQIQREGGYEGGEAMIHMPVTGPFAETVEKRVVEGVKRIVERVEK